MSSFRSIDMMAMGWDGMGWDGMGWDGTRQIEYLFLQLRPAAA